MHRYKSFCLSLIFPRRSGSEYRKSSVTEHSDYIHLSSDVSMESRNYRQRDGWRRRGREGWGVKGCDWAGQGGTKRDRRRRERAGRDEVRRGTKWDKGQERGGKGMDEVWRNDGSRELRILKDREGCN